MKEIPAQEREEGEAWPYSCSYGIVVSRIREVKVPLLSYVFLGPSMMSTVPAWAPYFKGRYWQSRFQREQPRRIKGQTSFFKERTNRTKKMILEEVLLPSHDDLLVREIQWTLVEEEELGSVVGDINTYWSGIEWIASSVVNKPKEYVEADIGETLWRKLIHQMLDETGSESLLLWESMILHLIRNLRLTLWLLNMIYLLELGFYTSALQLEVSKAMQNKCIAPRFSKTLEEPALEIASVLCVWRILVRGWGCLTGAADPWGTWGGLSVELGHEEVKELETQVAALFNCQLLLCRNLGYFCFEGPSCWCMSWLFVSDVLRLF